jgi:hypothetical protein
MKLYEWLLQGDVAIQYQTWRDVLDTPKPHLKAQIEKEGFGKQLLDLQKPNGHWSEGYYLYKWISTHYTLLEIRRLEMNAVPSVIKVIEDILQHYKVEDGGITANPERWNISDICLNGMLLFVFCYYNVKESLLESMIDRILKGQLSDGGFNCEADFKHVSHSSLHSTISLIEGFNEYLNNQYTYRQEDVRHSRSRAIEFVLMHKLYKSDRTGQVIHNDFLKLSYPPRWRYDILRALEALRCAGITYDERMEDAINEILAKQRKDGTWPVQKRHAGKIHFLMEKIGGPSRWNTLRVLRVLKFYKPNLYNGLMKEECLCPQD